MLQGDEMFEELVLGEKCQELVSEGMEETTLVASLKGPARRIWLENLRVRGCRRSMDTMFP